ncbi:helix-turn-helix transcriptional regulator [Bacillus horti]|uniref:DNA-binding transcriptional regulator YafY n=1 Tax=Caldalkalibacillus horti TaxID=77523 RepID=A0ABT9VY39_9BACI|nr:YafY family protein [Bacillus horti]MDQ0165897.1 putative DNA-binding transcriptional regulator YafY [Bacillus horti]
MNRIDRLLAIVIALQQRQETAQSLADKFEVSKRTIFRDLQSLAEMGIPLYSHSGPHGGIRLMDGYALPPLKLTTQEAMTLLFSLNAVTQLTDTPFNQERWTVIDKVKAILPEDQLRQLESVLKSFTIEIPKRSYKVPHLAPLLSYTANAVWLKVFYRSANHQRWLDILPQQVYTAHGFWYCQAYSATHEEVRTFRVDRMDNLEELDNIAMHEEVDVKRLAKFANQTHKSSNDQNLSDERIPIRVKVTYRGMLQVEQDPEIGECLMPISENEWEVRFDLPLTEWNWAVQFFYSLGLEAEVIAPEKLRLEIGGLAKKVYSTYFNSLTEK